jgi:hypothetical protein
LMPGLLDRRCQNRDLDDFPLSTMERVESRERASRFKPKNVLLRM